MSFDASARVGVVGAGTMGTGIGQIAATYGHPVVVCDTSARQLERAEDSLGRILSRLAKKGKLDPAEARDIGARIHFTSNLESLEDSAFVIEAIVEDMGLKQAAFRRIEQLVSEDSVLATNTSSLSITGIASAMRRPERLLATHFFNPAPLMPLVELVPGLRTEPALIPRVKKLMQDWGKIPVIARDTPGFIVNRVARPFYGEALRILEENQADVVTIDWAMRELGGFPMGPFQLMDLIGNDVNYKVTETVFEAFFYDPRFRPSFTQKRMMEAGLLGRKSGRGYYDYSEGAVNPEPDRDPTRGRAIVERILVMLINEAIDALFLGVASAEDIELAMTKGVRYPKGLLSWADEMTPARVLHLLEALQAEYGEDRYRPNPLLRRVVRGEASLLETAERSA